MPRKTAKQVREDALAKIEADNRIFWLYEFIQRAENGGHPVPNDANLVHGEPVYVVKKRELMEFVNGVCDLLIEYNELACLSEEGEAALVEVRQICSRILADNQFVVPLRKLGTPKE